MDHFLTLLGEWPPGYAAAHDDTTRWDDRGWELGQGQRQRRHLRLCEGLGRI